MDKFIDIMLSIVLVFATIGLGVAMFALVVASLTLIGVI